MARAGDGNNLRPQAAMNMHHFAIPLPRPLAPGQNVTVRLVQAGVPSAHGQQQHAHFHFVMQGQAASPVLRDSQGLGAQQEQSRQTVQKEVEEIKRKEEEEEERKAHLREQLTVLSPPSVTLDSVLLCTWTTVAVDAGDGRGSGAGDGRSSAVCYELMMEKGTDGPVVMYSGPNVNYSFPIDDLHPGHTYQFYVVASGYGEKGVASPRASLTIPALCPDKPLAPKVASRTKNNVVLKWSTPKDNGSTITNYSLEWDQCGRDFIEVFQGQQKQFKLNHKFPPASSCRFRLRVLNDVGWSEYSDNLVFKSGAGVPPPPPQPILTEASVGHLALKWAPPTDNGGSKILSYCLEMNDPENGYGFRPVYQGEELCHTSSGLQRVSTYHFRVAATNEAGRGPFSAPVTFQTSPAIPGCPGGPELKSRATSTALHIGWRPPLDNGGAEIQSYTVQLDDGHQGSFTDAYTGPELEHSEHNLTPGLTYRCRVCATSRAGHSNWTPPVEMKTQPTPPQAPAGLEVVGKPSQNSIILKMNPPGFDGGAVVTSYCVEMNKDDLWVKVATVANPQAFGGKSSTLTCSVTPLSPGTLYMFRANCINSCGVSPFSEVCTCHTAVGCPASPTCLEVGNKTANSMHLRWQPSKEFGSPLTGYQLEYGISGSKQCVVVTCDSLVCSHTLKALSPWSSYGVRARATSAVGNSEWSSPVQCTTLPSHPSSPSSLSVLSRTYNSLLIGWCAPDTNGADITQYCVEMVSPPLSICVPAMETQCMFRDLSPDTIYKVRVQAENAAGKGPFSAYILGSTLQAPPTPPQLVLVSAGSQHLKVSWGGGKRTGQSLLQYVLQYSTDGTRYHKAYEGTGPTHRLNKLHPATKYYLRVAALCDGVQSEWAEPAVFSTTPTPPPAPKGVVLSQINPSQLAVSWKPVQENCALPVVYVVQLKTFGTDYLQVYEGIETSCVVSMLAAKGLHEACVRAVVKCEVNGSVEKLWSLSNSEAHCECRGTAQDEGKEVVKQEATGQHIISDTSPLQNVVTLLKKEKCLTVAFFIGLFALIAGLIIVSRF